MNVARAVEAFELTLDPLKLLFVIGNVGVHSDHKCVAIAKSIGGSAGYAPRRSLGRNEGGNCIEIISQTRWRGGGFMISRDQKIWDATFRGQAIDERNEADIPLVGVGSVHDCVARLQNEAHRRLRIRKALYLGEHRVHDERMLILDRDAIAAATRVPIDDE